VEKLVYGGDGLGRIDGRVVFAPFVLPGERIRAKAEQEKPGLVRARYSAIAAAAITNTLPMNFSSKPSAGSCARNCAAWARSMLP